MKNSIYVIYQICILCTFDIYFGEDIHKCYHFAKYHPDLVGANHDPPPSQVLISKWSFNKLVLHIVGKINTVLSLLSKSMEKHVPVIKRSQDLVSSV